MLARSSLLLTLGGCYAELGLGYAGGNSATAHASAGIVIDLEDVAGLRIGGGGAIGRYEPAGSRAGAAIPAGVVFGGYARILGTPRDSLVASLDAHEPHNGRVSFRDPDASEKALATRAFVGLGYRHGWRKAEAVDPRAADAAPESVEEGSVVLALGPEMFYADPTNSALEGNSRYGGAFSVTFAIRAKALWQGIECLLDDKDDRCDGDPMN